jgi:hypothetical protein
VVVVVVHLLRLVVDVLQGTLLRVVMNLEGGLLVAVLAVVRVGAVLVAVLVVMLLPVGVRVVLMPFRSRHFGCRDVLALLSVLVLRGVHVWITRRGEMRGVVLVDVREPLPEDFEPPQVLVALGLAVPPLRAVLVQDEIQCKFAHILNKSIQMWWCIVP